MIPKFRAWLKEENEMIIVDTMNWFDDEFESIGDGITFLREAKKIELMQSTGLFDKNGKEIFEGDILGIDTDGEIVNVNIYWDSKRALFMFESKKYNEKEELAELFEDYTYSFEIIGNIYENPELLEV